MVGLGFVKGASSPCSFFHKQRGIKVVVHGVDFLCEGRMAELQWLQAEVAKEFLNKSQILWPEPGCERGIKLLNRRIRWENGGITWEADQRHIELLFDQLRLDMSKLSSVCTPAVKENRDKGIRDELNGESVDLVDIFACDVGNGVDSLDPRQDAGRVPSPAGACNRPKNMPPVDSVDEWFTSLSTTWQ